MKKFIFPLDSVLGYKGQILDAKQNEHGKSISAVNEQEDVIHKLLREYNDYAMEFKEKRANGLTVIEALGYESYLQFLNESVQKENTKLEDLKKIEEEKRFQVVEAKMETSTIERLKEKKRAEYDKQVQKSEELFIEEFVSNKMSSH